MMFESKSFIYDLDLQMQWVMLDQSGFWKKQSSNSKTLPMCLS